MTAASVRSRSPALTSAITDLISSLRSTTSLFPLERAALDAALLRLCVLWRVGPAKPMRPVSGQRAGLSIRFSCTAHTHLRSTPSFTPTRARSIASRLGCSQTVQVLGNFAPVRPAAYAKAAGFVGMAVTIYPYLAPVIPLHIQDELARG